MRSYTFDAAMVLKDPGVVAASGYAQVGGATKTIDLGSLTASFAAVAVIDVGSIEIASNDELYRLIVKGSDTEDFSGAIENLAELSLGAAEVRPGIAGDSLPGRYELPFVNGQADRTYRYIRLWIGVSGTVATGISFGAFIGRSSVAAM